MSGEAVKRVLDLVGSVAAVLVLSPILAAVAAGVWIAQGRPILFRQIRAGRAGTAFVLLKFRTMKGANGQEAGPDLDAARLTRFGRFLRATSLDELPELINVLRGDMSLVGPRPLLVTYNTRYSETQRRRLLVRPGLTGLAQVAGRNALSWDERFALDVWYVDHWSLWMDVKIVLKTIGVVLLRKGVSAEGHATMPEFTGPHDA